LDYTVVSYAIKRLEERFKERFKEDIRRFFRDGE